MAKFYHYSHRRMAILEPSVGENRHKNEDPNAVGKPLVWLYDCEVGNHEDSKGVHEYLHVVEMDLNDPLLAIDRIVEEFNSQLANDAGFGSLPKTYVYTGTLNVIAVKEWNEEQSMYLEEPLSAGEESGFEPR